MISGFEVFDAVKTGTVAMAHSSPAFFPGVIDGGEAEINLPFCWQNPEEIYYVYYEMGMIDLLRDEYRKNGVHLVGICPAFGYATISTKPIKRLADFAGLKMQAMGIMGEFAGKWGASPVVMSPKEVGTALSMGTLDAAFIMTDGVYYQKLYEFVDYYIYPSVQEVFVFDYIVNLDEWNKLPDDIKQILEWTCLDSGLMDVAISRSVRQWQASEMRVNNLIEEVYLPEEDVEAMWEMAIGIWDEYATTGPVAKEVIEMKKEYLKWQGIIK